MRSDNVFLSFLKRKRGLFLPALLLLVGVVFLLVAGSGRSSGGADSSLESYRASLEDELASLCSSVKGVGKCRVFVTFSSGEETVRQGSGSVSTSPPKVASVTVVCRGGDDDRVRAELVSMLSAAFGIGKNRVSILRMS